MKQIWNHKYVEKHLKELHTNIFRSLEIEQYLKKTLSNYKLKLQKYQLNFTSSTISILLSVCKVKLTNFKKKKKIVKKQSLNSICYKVNAVEKFVQTLNTCKQYRIKNEIKKQKVVNSDGILNKMIQSLKLFTQNKLNISITIKEINFLNSIEEVRQAFTDLYKFQKNSFFSEGHKILASVVNQKSAQLLTNFIAAQLQKLTKQQTFFLNFLKESLTLLLTQKFSNIQGIKILIKGRIKKANRSKTYLLKLGKISLICVDSNISYAESTAFTSSKGTIGVKAWISNKI